MGTFWALFAISAKSTKNNGSEVSDFTKEFWSGRPGSNRRRPAWEFSIENDVFYFINSILANLFRRKTVHLILSIFN